MNKFLRKNWDVLLAYVVLLPGIIGLLTCDSWGCIGAAVFLFGGFVIGSLLFLWRWLYSGQGSRLWWFAPHVVATAWVFLAYIDARYL